MDIGLIVFCQVSKAGRADAAEVSKEEQKVFRCNHTVFVKISRAMTIVIFTTTIVRGRSGIVIACRRICAAGVLKTFSATSTTPRAIGENRSSKLVRLPNWGACPQISRQDIPQQLSAEDVRGWVSGSYMQFAEMTFDG